jgi:hypothetical protein
VNTQKQKYERLFTEWQCAKEKHESLLYSNDRPAVIKARAEEQAAWEALCADCGPSSSAEKR